MNGSLMIVNGHEEGRRVALAKGEFSIGFGATHDLDLSGSDGAGCIRCAADPSAARFVVTAIEDGHPLVNERAMAVGDTLEHGDLICLGRIRIWVGIGDEAPRRGTARLGSLKAGS